jgi:5-methyltetrahydrofolate--homocysteine methyltransferase
VSDLLDEERSLTFAEENKSLQEELREVYGRRRAKKIVGIAEVRQKGLQIDWVAKDIAQPTTLGRQVLDDFPLEEILPFIDWTFFFKVWELKGRYPQVLDHPEYGTAARELFANAQSLLGRIVEGKLLQARGVWGLWPASAQGDDVLLFDEKTPEKEIARFCMLRQQEEKPDANKPYRSLADFVAPQTTGLRDHVGAFAVATGFGVSELVARFEAEHDDYNAIMVKALADRLAEAFAELLHQKVRHAWGYGLDETLDSTALIAEKYRGIRPAFGYPASPDHTEKSKLWSLLDAASLGMQLTENFAVTPAAAVNGLYLAHPRCSYFAIGKIGRDQVVSYAERKGMELAEAERWLAPNLAYEPGG